MSILYDTIVIGAGQAGLASAYYLQRARSRFLVLDGSGQIGESWLRRWDSLRLFTPVRYNSLPGLPFPGEPYALPVKDSVAKYLQAYVAHFALPVRLNTRVSSATCGGLHETEVEHLNEILSTPDPPEVNIRRLDVAMYHSSCVGFFE